MRRLRRAALSLQWQKERLTLYARFVDAAEAIEVTFDTMGGP